MIEYDYEVLMSILLIVYKKLSSTAIIVQPIDVVVIELGAFGPLDSIEESTFELFKT